MSNGEHWPLRVELIPQKDKKRNTKGFIVAKNEFGREEWYASFFKRMSDKKLTYNDYNEIIEVNKEGIWKLHPLRNQYEHGELKSIPLRINLDKEGWKQ